MNSVKKSTIISFRYISLIVMVGSCFLAKAFSEDIQWERTWSVSDTSKSIGRVVLDFHLLEKSQPNFSDLRLKNPRGESIGFTIRDILLPIEKCEINDMEMKRIEARIIGDTAFEAIYLSEDSTQIPSQINVDINDQDFEINASVWTATSPLNRNNLSGGELKKIPWELECKNEPLYDYASLADLRKETVTWDSRDGSIRNGNHLVKILLNGLSKNQRSVLTSLTGKIGAPERESFEIVTRMLRVNGIGFKGKSCSNNSFISAEDSLQLVSENYNHPIGDTANKATWYIVNAENLSLNSVTLQTNSRNFLREVQIRNLDQNENTGDVDSTLPWTWSILKQDQIHHIDWGKTVDSSLNIKLNSSIRLHKIAIGIINHDDKPLQISGLVGFVNQKEMLFPTSELGVFSLTYDGKENHAFQSDFSNLVSTIEKNQIQTYLLEKPKSIKIIPNQSGSNTLSSKIFSDKNLLMAGLIFAMLTLAGLFYLVVRKAKPKI